MLLLMLRHATRFLVRSSGRELREDTRIATLEAVKAQYVTQILIDEVTDFSPVEIGCMCELAHPSFRSCFACGDVRQRVTVSGIRSLEELKWISEDVDVRAITTGYRQSRRLADLANAVGALSSGELQPIVPPEGIENPGVPPLLGENLTGGPLATWLARRIREVEQALGLVPSVAIFVDGDGRIDPLVADLKPLLAAHNLDVVGCKEGRVVGGEAQIRVFDVQYVKGLEFEVAFFIGVDSVAAHYDDLFYNLLYVGITRAATYLAITSESTLPGNLEAVRNHFTSAGAW